MAPPRAAEMHTARARLAKARQFAETAALLYDPQREAADNPDAFVTSAVHAGIAAADVICIRRLGEYSISGAHDEAVTLLRRVDKSLATQLARLLRLKTKAGYSADPVSAHDVAIAQRAHRVLLDSAVAAL